MSAGKAVAVVLILAVAAGGCATPSAADLEHARSARQSIAAVLSGFSEAIRNKDAASAMALIAPEVSDVHRARIEQAIKQAVWMELYRGYRIDIECAVARLNRRTLRDGRAELRVRATNAEGFEFKDRFVAARSGSDWLLNDVSLQEPLEYERLDPPLEDAQEIRSLLERIFASLKEGRPAEVFYMPPKQKEFLYRTAKRSFWRSLLGDRPRSYNIYEDLRTMCRFRILAWPDVAKDRPLAYVAPGMVVACYDIPYPVARGRHHDGGQFEDEDIPPPAAGPMGAHDAPALREGHSRFVAEYMRMTLDGFLQPVAP